MRKKIIRTFVALLLALALAPTAAWAESATVLGDAVNLREGPGIGYPVVDTIPGGAEVEVTDMSNVAWFGVSYHGKSGYMSTGYLRVNYNSDTATVSYSEPSYASAPAEEGTAVIILEGSSPTAQAPAQSSSVIIELPAETASPAPTATSSPAPAPTATAAPASTGSTVVIYPAVDEETEEGTAVIILGDNTIYLPATHRACGGHGQGGEEGLRQRRFRLLSFRAQRHGRHHQHLQQGQGADNLRRGERGLDAREHRRCAGLREHALHHARGGVSRLHGGRSATPAGSTANGGNAYITGNNVRFRSAPSMSSAILGEFFYGNSVTVTGTSGDWTAVSYNGKSGYVYSRYVKSGSFQASTPAQSGGTVAAGSATGQQIADYALQYVGCRYVWGGTSPETGFDCSGFVQYVYKHFGYQLNRVACDQAQNGVHVDSDQLQPGDVLCFYSSASYIGHTGIYIGNNRFVHASTSTTGVIISELNGYYFTRGYEARRIV